jgi:hypothetical protein
MDPPFAFLKKKVTQPSNFCIEGRTHLGPALSYMGELSEKNPNDLQKMKALKLEIVDFLVLHESIEFQNALSKTGIAR